MLSAIFNYLPTIRAPQPPPGLLESLSQEGDQHEPLRQAFIYLADHSHAELEQAVKEKFNSQGGIEQLFQENTSGLEKYQLLRGYCNIASLDDLKARISPKAIDPIELATREKRFLPKPTCKTEPTVPSTSHYWERYSLPFGKAVHWVVALPIGLGAAMLHHATHFLHKPGTSLSDIKSFLLLPRLAYKTAGIPFFVVTKFVASRCSSREALIAIAATSALAYTGLYYLTQHVLKFGAPKQVDKKGAFRNLNEEVEKGLIREGIERPEILQKVLPCWADVGLGFKFIIPFLVGLAGSGKTQFVEQLAYRCARDQNFEHYGKTVLYINASTLVSSGSDFIKHVFWKIKDHKNDFILFFDEAHNLNTEIEGKPKMLEEFKSFLLNENIRCIMATTEKEYNAHILPNDAFVERTKQVHVPSLEPDLTKHLLNELRLKYGSDDITDGAIREIMDIVNTHDKYQERANPRKALQAFQEVISAAEVWRPQVSAMQLSTAIREETDSIASNVANCTADEQWILKDNTQSQAEYLQTVHSRIQECQAQEKRQQEKLQEFRALHTRKKALEGEISRLVHTIDENSPPELQKEYLATKFFFHRHVRKSLEKAKRAFEKVSSEKIPFPITPEFVRKSLLPTKSHF